MIFRHAVVGSGRLGAADGYRHNVDIRTATTEDEPAILRLLASSMKRPDDPRFAWLYRWKHDQNHFGPSYRWVMVEGAEIIGVRLFMRWRFVGCGRTWQAVRAVDTATHPDHQGRGVFKALTLHALGEAHDDGVDFVFNTPNDQSRPGYLKMDWTVVGRLRPMVRPRLRSLTKLRLARVPASHWGEPLTAGRRVAEVAGLMAARGSGHSTALRTQRSDSYLTWRYPDRLGYRAFSSGAGLAIARVRERGPLREASLTDIERPGRSAFRLLSEILARTDADVVLGLGLRVADGAAPAPGDGPTLVQRPLRSQPPLRRDGWDLALGDIELF